MQGDEPDGPNAALGRPATNGRRALGGPAGGLHAPRWLPPTDRRPLVSAPSAGTQVCGAAPNAREPTRGLDVTVLTGAPQRSLFPREVRLRTLGDGAEGRPGNQGAGARAGGGDAGKHC